MSCMRDSEQGGQNEDFVGFECDHNRTYEIRSKADISCILDFKPVSTVTVIKQDRVEERRTCIQVW